MQDLIPQIENRVKKYEADNIKKFFYKIENMLITQNQKDLFVTGQENTIIILPLELDYDMIFAGLILPLLRDNLIEKTDFVEYDSAFELANSVLLIEKGGLNIYRLHQLCQHSKGQSFFVLPY